MPAMVYICGSLLTKHRNLDSGPSSVTDKLWLQWYLSLLVDLTYSREANVCPLPEWAYEIHKIIYVDMLGKICFITVRYSLFTKSKERKLLIDFLGRTFYTFKNLSIAFIKWYFKWHNKKKNLPQQQIKHKTVAYMKLYKIYKWDNRLEIILQMSNAVQS